MLNPFPDLLMFGFFGPTLLRIAVAWVFGYLAYYHFAERKHIAVPEVLVWISAALYTFTSIGLLLGYHTQIASLAGLVILIGHKILKSRFPMRHELPQSTLVLVAIILLSLLVTGAGAFAFDLPL